jgi:ABC-2 type transport system permease protein
VSSWKLEWLRLVRTRRWLVLAGTFVFFGLAGPVTIHYLPQLLSSQLAEMKIALPEPPPAAGVAEFAETLSGVGLVVVVVVAAAALCVDANPTLSAFYRTRTADAWSLLAPRYVVTVAAVSASFLIGTAAAWYETVVLLGRVSGVDVVVAAGLCLVYLGFAVAAVAFAASIVRSALATVGVSLSILIALPIVATYEPIGRWSPSALAGAFGDILEGGGVATYGGPVTSAFVLTVTMLSAARLRLNRREL